MKQREPAVGWFQGARSGRAQTDGGTGGPRNGMQTPVAQTTQKSLMMTQSQTGILHSAQCEIRTDDLTRALYATDAFIYQMRSRPSLFPQSARSQVAVEAGSSSCCAARNTALAGGGRVRIIIDFARYNRISTSILTNARCASGRVVSTSSTPSRETPGFCFGPDVACSRATLAA